MAVAVSVVAVSAPMPVMALIMPAAAVMAMRLGTMAPMAVRASVMRADGASVPAMMRPGPAAPAGAADRGLSGEGRGSRGEGRCGGGFRKGQSRSGQAEHGDKGGGEAAAQEFAGKVHFDLHQRGDGFAPVKRECGRSPEPDRNDLFIGDLEGPHHVYGLPCLKALQLAPIEDLPGGRLLGARAGSSGVG